MDLDYEKLLERAREGLEDVMQNAERFSPPVPDIMHEGSKKTIIRNFSEIVDSLRRDVRQYYESKGVEIIRVEDQDYHDLDVRRCVFARLCCFDVYSTLFIFYNNRSH